ncbi:MAG: phage protease [Campylobacterota bacterium]|nr:phage protease [Campylobacterota bacterium]
MNLNKLSYSDNLSLFALSSKKKKLAKVLIAVIGEWHGHSAGSFEITTEIMQQMIDNFNKQLVDVVCDYEHQTLTKEKAVASGWIKSLAIEDDKLYANVEWTDKAKAEITDKQYRYVSPVYNPNTTDPKSGKDTGWSIHSLSLTNKPFLEELGEVIANNNKNFISLKEENIKLSEQIKEANRTIESLTDEKAVIIVNSAIAEGKLHPNQKEYAIKQAKVDISGFESFIANNTIHPFFNDKPLYANSTDDLKKGNDIDDMVSIASKVNDNKH